MRFTALLTVLASSTAFVLVACTTPTLPLRQTTQAPEGRAPKFSWGQTVDFEGVSFRFNSARITPYYTNWIGQQTSAGSSFLNIDVTMVNKTGVPMPHYFQPIFQLIDDSGARYEPDVQHGIGINMRQSGRIAYGSSLNPNTNITQEVVFDVPRRKYLLRVIVPNRARVGFAGSTTSSGLYFTYDMSTQLRSHF